jgi:hypothetical protein
VGHDYGPNQYDVSSHFATQCYQNVESFDSANPKARNNETPNPDRASEWKVSLQREIDGRKPPLIQWYGSFRGFGIQEFEMQQLQDSLSFKSPNSVMGIRVRDRRLLRVWIQWSMGFRDFSLNSDHSPCVSFDG